MGRRFVFLEKYDCTFFWLGESDDRLFVNG